MDLIELHNERLIKSFPCNKISKFSVVKEDDGTEPSKVIVHFGYLDEKEMWYLKGQVRMRKSVYLMFKGIRFFGTPVKFAMHLEDDSSGLFIENINWQGDTLLDRQERMSISYGSD